MFPLLFNFIKQWFKRQNITSKVLIVILFLATLYIGYISIQKGYYKYKYFKGLETQVTTLQDSLQSSNERINDLLTKGKTTTINVKKNASAIDKKLQEDEKTIDNANVSDTELHKFLAKYE